MNTTTSTNYNTIPTATLINANRMRNKVTNTDDNLTSFDQILFGPQFVYRDRNSDKTHMAPAYVNCHLSRRYALTNV